MIGFYTPVGYVDRYQDPVCLSLSELLVYVGVAGECETEHVIARWKATFYTGLVSKNYFCETMLILLFVLLSCLLVSTRGHGLLLHDEPGVTVRLAGFQFCKHLDYSIFRIEGLRKLDTAPEQWTATIDRHALEYYESKLTNLKLLNLREDLDVAKILRKSPAKSIDRETARRFACYVVADGSNEFFKVATVPVMVNVDPVNYFPDVRFTQPSSYHHGKTCRIGIMLLVTSMTDNVVRLLQRLTMMPDTLILINVDAKFPAVKNKLFDHLVMNKSKYFNRVFLNMPSKNIFWGHSSMVFAQHDGFFKLLDMGQCEYFINLSDTHYPLSSMEHIYQRLVSAGKDVNWFGHTFSQHQFVHKIDMDKRILSSPIFLTNTSDPGAFSGKAKLKRKLKLRYLRGDIKKADQWMILSRKFVHKLRSDPLAIHALTSMEFTLIPDEIFYPSVANMIVPQNEIHEQATTYVEWKIFKPVEFKLSDAQRIEQADEKGYMFARKINDVPLQDFIDYNLLGIGLKYHHGLVSRSPMTRS